MAEGIRDAITTQPEFRLTEDMDPEDKFVLESIEKTIHQDPSLAQEGLDLYTAAPEHTENLIEFIRQHPEGAMALLQNWGKIWRERLDFDVEFDQGTEDAVTADPLYKKDIADFQASNDERYRERFRKRRWDIFIRHSKDTAA